MSCLWGWGLSEWVPAPWRGVPSTEHHPQPRADCTSLPLPAVPPSHNFSQPFWHCPSPNSPFLGGVPSGCFGKDALINPSAALAGCPPAARPRTGGTGWHRGWGLGNLHRWGQSPPTVLLPFIPGLALPLTKGPITDVTPRAVIAPCHFIKSRDHAGRKGARRYPVQSLAQY